MEGKGRGEGRGREALPQTKIYHYTTEYNYLGCKYKYNYFSLYK